MTQPELDKGSPSLRPHGDILKTPGASAEQEPQPADKPDTKPAESEEQRQPLPVQPRGDEPSNG